MQTPELPATKPRLETRLQATLECHRIAAVKHKTAGRIDKAKEHEEHEETLREALELVRKKVKPKTTPGKPNRPADLLEAKAYAHELSLNDEEAVKFFDHFTSNGWKVGGKAPMKDWRAAMRMWKSRNPDSAIANGNGTSKTADPEKWRAFHAAKSYPYVRYSEAKGWMHTEFKAWLAFQ